MLFYFMVKANGRPPKHFDIDLSNPSLYYILGAVLADGDISEYVVRFRTRDKDFVNNFLVHCRRLDPHLVNDNQPIVSIVRRRPYYTVQIGSMYFCKILQQVILKKNFATPEFLNSFLDGDGTVCFSVNKGVSYCHVSFYNTDSFLISEIKKGLDVLKIRYSLSKHIQRRFAYFFGKRVKRRQTYFYAIRIHANYDNILLLSKHVTPSIKRKRHALKKILAYLKAIDNNYDRDDERMLLFTKREISIAKGRYRKSLE
jgi:hypothetical protein